ncbi:hypothetical protein [Desulfonatronum parangueonense]
MSAAEQHEAKTDAQKPGYKPIDEEVFEMKSGSDFGKVALFVALLAVILMVILYFSQQQNITGMSDQLGEVQQVRQEIVVVQDQIASLEAEMEALKGLPAEARKIVISSLLNESASKINYLSTRMETDEQQAKMREIQKMLEEVQAGIE